LIKEVNYSPVQEYLGILIDYSRDKTIPEQGLALLTGKGFYKKPWENSPQESFARSATCFSFGDYELAQRIYDYVSKGWFTFASPVLSNSVNIEWPTFGADEFEEAGDWLQENVEPDGLPISCFLSSIPDTKEGLVAARSEAAWLSMMGGGVGIYAGMRSPDEKSTGVMAHLRGYDADTLSYKQTATRRGSMAAYLDIDHPEILSFMQMRNPVGGDSNKKCFNLNNAVNITDNFMNAVIKGQDYELIDPKHGPTGRMLNAQEVWEELMSIRYETGEPYIMFKDTVNRNIPSWITHPLYNVTQSNLCSEITLRTTEKRTAVCCLSSINLEKYEEWKDTSIVQDLVRLLDNVLEYFIRLAPPELKRAVHSASKERAIGLGTLGWHSFLQSKSIPFETGGFDSAVHWTHKLYDLIKSRAVESSLALAKERGECDDCYGSGMRNSHLLAIAPNASSSSMVGASPSIEPWAANAFNAQGRAGSFLIKNKYLVAILEKLGKNTPDVWKDIIVNGGSVQHLDFLDSHTKKVFKTANEINPAWVVELASARQPKICQSQSLNIKVRNDITLQEMSDIHIKGWLSGIKTFYYCRSEPATRANLGTGSDKPLNSVPVMTKVEFEECLSCSG
jgi:ribonucleoside-diphosphate reductase alpha chain